MKKAVIPAAGFGTRFLPFTKAVPKEMIPLVDKPVIQYVVEEAAAAGLTDILIVISTGKNAIQEHFIPAPEVEARLAATGKNAILDEMRRINRIANIQYVYQHELSGLGDAIRYAESFVGDEPFAILLGDTVTASETAPVTAQLVAAHNQNGSSVIAAEEVPREKTSRYGIIDGETQDGALYRIKNIVEKPAPEVAPSTLAVASRYLFTPEIFRCLRTTAPGGNGEIQLTDAIQMLLAKESVYALKTDGRRYDIGNKLDFVKATVEFALQRPEFAAPLREWLGKLR